MADLFGTYSKRIKITVDHTEIDSDLSWFPVTVFLTNSQGEEVFTEFDADEDFDRIAFTTSDESTQLYADCELFDDSEQKAIYHVSKDGWTVSSSTDTDIYLYYDKSAGHNTTYIGKAGTNQFNDWTETYDGSVTPDNDGWSKSSNDDGTSDGDILTIDTTDGAVNYCYYQQTPDIDFDSGVYLKARVKIDTSTPDGKYALIFLRDGTQNEKVYLFIYETKIHINGTNYNITTTDDYHIYELYIKATEIKAYIDGVSVITETVDSEAGADLIKFGDDLTTSGFNVKCYIDYLNYALGVSYNPCEVHTNVWDSNFKFRSGLNDFTTSTILDSTSNHNDGTKKAANQPIEATGKVGQGQDFDGNDDYISLGNPSDLQFTGAMTLEAIVTIQAGDTDVARIISKDDGTNRSYLMQYSDSSSTYARWGIFVSGSFKTSGRNTTALNTGNPCYLAGTNDQSNLVIYYNGTSENSSEDGDAVDNDSVNVEIGRNQVSTEYFNGIIDEVRMSNTNRSAAWIAATYDSLWDNLLTYGDEETEEEEEAATNVLFIFQNF